MFIFLTANPFQIKDQFLQFTFFLFYCFTPMHLEETLVTQFSIERLKVSLQVALWKKSQNESQSEQYNILRIGCSCLIDKWNERATDNTPWSKLPRGQSCRVQQKFGEEVRKRSSKQVCQLELWGKQVGKSIRLVQK